MSHNRQLLRYDSLQPIFAGLECAAALWSSRFTGSLPKEVVRQAYSRMGCVHWGTPMDISFTAEALNIGVIVFASEDTGTGRGAGAVAWSQTRQLT